MSRGDCRLMILALTLFSAPAAGDENNPLPAAAQTTWEVHRGDGFVVAAPARWRKFPFPARSRVLQLTGDGIGLPVVDETKQPVQAGMMVERFAGSTGTAKEAATDNLSSLQANPRFDVLGKPAVGEVKLADGTTAALLSVEFLRKDKQRKSTYFKLYAMQGESTGWVVTGFLVTGKDSKLTTNRPELVSQLRACVQSICFNEKQFSEAGVRAAYTPAEKAR